MKITNNPEGCTDKAITQTPAPGASANNININLSGATLLVIIMLTVMLGVCGIVIGFDIAEHANMTRSFNELQRSVDVARILLQDHDALLIRDGLKQPGDIAKGPTGNLEYLPPNRSK